MVDLRLVSPLSREAWDEIPSDWVLLIEKHYVQTCCEVTGLHPFQDLLPRRGLTRGIWLAGALYGWLVAVESLARADGPASRLLGRPPVGHLLQLRRAQGHLGRRPRGLRPSTWRRILFRMGVLEGWRAAVTALGLGQPPSLN